MPQTLAQKILQAHTDEVVEQDGQIVQCRVSLVLANDITGPLAIKSFKGMGAEKVFDKDKIALVMDHFTPQKDIDSANQVMVTRKFAQEQNITHYYEGGDCGVEHTLLPEQGLVGPGDVVIGADSHTCTYGGIGAFATGMGSTDIAAAMALGETWFKVPSTIRVNIDGQMPKWLRGKDLMLMLIGAIGVDGALYKALEFGGSVVDDLSVEGRLCMANMAIEAGGKVGLFAVDAKTRAYCAEHKRPGLTQDLAADPGAVYERVVNIDVTGKEPVVACPHLPSNVKPVSEVRDTPIQQVVIGSCTNGRIEDLRAVAKVVEGKKVAATVDAMIGPGSGLVKEQAEAEGLDKIFIAAGFEWREPGCSMCLAMNPDKLKPEERCASTSNRNFEGRQGFKGRTHLVSPAMAAAAAIAGHFVDVREWR